MTIRAGSEFDHITEEDGRAALDRFIARARATTVYPFLLKRSGRGRPVCHLVGADGTHPLCGALINGERWELATVTRRRVCRRCVALRRRAQQEAQ